MNPDVEPRGNSSVHAVVFMYPLQGHIIPAFNFAKKLAANGVVVTLVCTEGCHARILKAHGGRDLFADEANRLALDIRSAVVSDGLPIDFDRSLNGDEFSYSLLNQMESHVEEFMRNLQTKEIHVSCIIADTFFVWPDRIANKFGVPHVSFWTESVMVFSIYYSWDLLVKNGHHPFIANGTALSPPCFILDLTSQDNVGVCIAEEETIDYIAAAPALKLTDLPSYLQEGDVSTLVHRLIYEAFRSAREADWIISNTIHEMESRTADLLQAQAGTPFMSVGPLLPSHVMEDRERNDEVGSASMWAESDCTKWLDSKATNSVLYISFGSFAHVSIAQIHEMAMGLLISKQPFIWVLRPDIVASNVQDILPQGFLEECSDQGMVVSWCSQLDILHHSSVGGFLTHCGWNSIMEGLWVGVAMLAFPLLTDQYTNCRLVVEEWSVAMRLGGISRSSKNMRSKLVHREEIATSIKEFMGIDGEQGKKIRSNVKNVREVMKRAVMREGSSHKNLELFVEELKARDRNRYP